MDMSKLSEKLRKYRVENRLTIDEMARVFGVTQSYYHHWERGRRTPDKAYIAAKNRMDDFCEVLGCSLEDLL